MTQQHIHRSINVTLNASVSNSFKSTMKVSADSLNKLNDAIEDMSLERNDATKTMRALERQGKKNTDEWRQEEQRIAQLNKDINKQTNERRQLTRALRDQEQQQKRLNSIRQRAVAVGTFGGFATLGVQNLLQFSLFDIVSDAFEAFRQTQEVTRIAGIDPSFGQRYANFQAVLGITSEQTRTKDLLEMGRVIQAAIDAANKPAITRSAYDQEQLDAFQAFGVNPFQAIKDNPLKVVFDFIEGGRRLLREGLNPAEIDVLIDQARITTEGIEEAVKQAITTPENIYQRGIEAFNNEDLVLSDEEINRLSELRGEMALLRRQFHLQILGALEPYTDVISGLIDRISTLITYILKWVRENSGLIKTMARLAFIIGAMVTSFIAWKLAAMGVGSVLSLLSPLLSVIIGKIWGFNAAMMANPLTIWISLLRIVLGLLSALAGNWLFRKVFGFNTDGISSYSSIGGGAGNNQLIDIPPFKGIDANGSNTQGLVDNSQINNYNEINVYSNNEEVGNEVSDSIVRTTNDSYMRWFSR